MGSMMRRLRKAQAWRGKNRVAYDFETRPLRPGSYGAKVHENLLVTCLACGKERGYGPGRCPGIGCAPFLGGDFFHEDSPTSYEYREELEGQWRQGPHPDIIFFDESHGWDEYQALIAEGNAEISKAILAVDPGSIPATVVTVKVKL